MKPQFGLNKQQEKALAAFRANRRPGPVQYRGARRQIRPRSQTQGFSDDRVHRNA
jgi:hypothetical protein